MPKRKYAASSDSEADDSASDTAESSADDSEATGEDDEAEAEAAAAAAVVADLATQRFVERLEFQRLRFTLADAIMLRVRNCQLLLPNFFAHEQSKEPAAVLPENLPWGDIYWRLDIPRWQLAALAWPCYCQLRARAQEGDDDAQKVMEACKSDLLDWIMLGGSDGPESVSEDDISARLAVEDLLRPARVILLHQCIAAAQPEGVDGTVYEVHWAAVKGCWGVDLSGSVVQLECACPGEKQVVVLRDTQKVIG